MVPGKSEDPGPNPQRCDIDYSQSREWGHQGWLGHIQEGQKGRMRYRELRRVLLRDFHNFSVVDLPLVKSTDGLSVVGLQSFHCTLIQQLEYLWWQIDSAIISFEGLLGSWLLSLGLNGGLEGLPGLGGGGCLDEAHKVSLEQNQRHLSGNQHQLNLYWNY